MNFTKEVKAQLGEYAKAFKKYENIDSMTMCEVWPGVDKDICYIDITLGVKYDEEVIESADMHYLGKVILTDDRVIFKYKASSNTKFWPVATFEDLQFFMEKCYRQHIKDYLQQKQNVVVKAIEKLPG